jgi:hypothetical protein
MGTQRLFGPLQHLCRCGWQQCLPHRTVWPGLQRQPPSTQVWVSRLQHFPAPMQHRVPGGQQNVRAGV